MSLADKTSSRKMRSAYNAAFDLILTPSRKEIRDAIIRLTTINRKSRDSARLGAVIQGSPTVGKTTLVKYIGKRYQIVACRLHVNMFGQDQTVAGTAFRFIPVVFISLGAHKNREKVSLSGFLKKICKFYGIVITKKMNEDDVIEAIIGKTRECKTSLFILDEISNLDLRFIGAEIIIETIKDLMNHISATFIFAGIATKAGEIFAGYDPENYKDFDGQIVAPNKPKRTRRKKSEDDEILNDSQFYHRLQNFPMLPFKDKLSEEFDEIIDRIDREIRLVNHRVGNLRKLTPYLMQRTDGYIGAIQTLVRHGCEIAIADTTEKITKPLLDKVRVDFAAETQKTKRQAK